MHSSVSLFSLPNRKCVYGLLRSPNFRNEQQQQIVQQQKVFIYLLGVRREPLACFEAS